MTVGSFSCMCSTDFDINGECQKPKMDQCEDQPDFCANEGICISSVDGLSCACVNGWGGIDCTEQQNESF